MFHFKAALIIGLTFISSSVFATGLLITSPLPGSKVEATFTLKGNCDRRGQAVTLLGELTNPGSVLCSRKNQFSYEVNVTNTTGFKLLTARQAIAGKTQFVSRSFSFVVPTPMPTPP